VLTRILSAVLALSVGFVIARGVAAADTREQSREQARVQTWVRQAADGLDSRAVEALSRIHPAERQLLALRAYLRAGSGLTQRWSWSQEQQAAYPTSAEGTAALADVDAVERAFADANPGFTARARRMPRSLESQLSHWNENKSVGSVASALQASLTQQFPAGAAPASGSQIRQALSDWAPQVPATLAAPGLSAHGQGRAFDFEIEHDGKTVAGFDASSAHVQWDASGWTDKLHAAVAASGKPFTGPLQSPYEPWHYAYAPTGAQ
jgi:hypothetical protein